MDDDRRAFAELVRRHQSAVRNLLRRLAAGDPALADDLAQEVFVKAWRGLASWRGDARFSTWLYRIAWNAWASHARRTPAPEPPAPEPVPAEAEAVLRRLDLERAFGRLREEERAALALAYGEDVTHEEAAAILREGPTRGRGCSARRRPSPRPSALPGLLQGAGAALVAVGPPAAGLALAAAGETLLAAAVTALALALAE